ncbi:MAG TPA: ubiquinol-cytochrome c reductase iron-sulfur subunit [Candidatus Acidoferrales bacterium]|nr:ubiquinol-cytochrome c reductase iron-sulfur subunit [Candidatus Acidoferrales bacterium]
MSLSRRSFLNRILAGGAAIFSAYVIYPVIRFLIPPPVPLDAQTRVQAATIDELKPNSAKFFRFLDKPAVLVHLQNGSYEALSAKCTHLGCTVAFEQDKDIFYCNCHGSQFNIDGKVIKGPAALPLTQYAVSVSGDDIFVTTQNQQV